MNAGNPPVARDYLDSLAMHGIKLGLHNIEFLLARGGHPERQFPAVHIAGTNGKGSVTALLHAMLQAGGYRAGRFTSPHLLDLRERFQINGTCISESDLEEATAVFRTAAAALSHPPTFFELNTAIAFAWFAKQKVDIALVEVGLGGRLDSTNVISPLACAITNIDLEHTEYLGDTLEKIAGEKAGILKPDTPAVVSELKAGPQRVILDQAEKVGAPVSLLGRDFHYEVTGDPWQPVFSYRSPHLQLAEVPLSLAGRHQAANAATAVALAELCREHFPQLTEEAIREGLMIARWPGRLERVLDHPAVIMDAAHNAAGARLLAEMFTQAVVVTGVASDKDAPGMLSALGRFAAPLILTQFSGDRALPAEQLARHADTACEVIPELEAAIARGIALASKERPLLITGSIYLGGEARQILINTHGAATLQF